MFVTTVPIGMGYYPGKRDFELEFKTGGFEENVGPMFDVYVVKRDNTPLDPKILLATLTMRLYESESETEDKFLTDKMDGMNMKWFSQKFPFA